MKLFDRSILRLLFTAFITSVLGEYDVAALANAPRTAIRVSNPPGLSIVTFKPSRNALNVAPDPVVSITFDTTINASSLTDSSVCINGSVSGRHTALFSCDTDSTTVSIVPSRPFSIGEIVTVTVTRRIVSASGDSLSRSYSLSFSVETNSSSGHYLLSTSIPMGTGTSPHAVAPFDADTNGILDLAVADYGTGAIAILKNDGTGTLTQTSTITVGNLPNMVISADINNDGSPDLIATNNGSGTISVLKNNGTGSFMGTTITVGNHPVSVTAADFDGDGWVDLAVANNYSSNVTILRNVGNGVFTTSATVGVGFYPGSIASADLNNDGFIDLAVTNTQSNSVSILLNNGNGTFSVSSSPTVGSIPWDVVAADLNGDGFLDLATTNNASGTSTILINDGTGHFFVGSTLTLGGGPASVTAVDANGDGFLDLAFGNVGLNTLSIWNNNGSGSFSPGAVVNVGSYPCSVRAADFDGDGKIELAVVGALDDVVSIVSLPPHSATIVTASSSISFGSVAAATSKSEYFTISNYGTDSTLVIGSVKASTPAFTVDRSSLLISPNGTDSVLVTFHPIVGGAVFNDTLSIVSNDVKKPSLKILLTGFSGGLVAYYPFQGDANDTTGNGYNGVVFGATLTADRFGHANSAYDFNGVNAAIEYEPILNEIFCAPAAKFSIVGWARTRAYGNLATGVGGFIIGKDGGGNGPYQWNVTHADTTLVGGVYSDTLAQNYLMLGSPLSLNRWFQFALVFDGSLPLTQRLKLYVNAQTSGVFIFDYAGVLGASTTQCNQPLVIGATCDNNNPFALSHFYNGTIDDIRIYSQPLAQSEIDSLYHLGGWPLTGVDTPAGEMPTSYSLDQNYPNPFNPSTIIRYGLPERSHVSIQVYDVLGQVVAVLVNSEQSAGWNEVAWHANVASGLYFYRIEAVPVNDPDKRFVDVKKMMLLK